MTRRRKSKCALVLLRRLAVGLSVGLYVGPVNPATAAETVQSLRYGASLFHYYQGDYFDALSELMVGQARGSLGPHTEHSELLRGGISLSYGMDRQAEAIFTEQLAPGGVLANEEHPDRDRAWFYLGKAAWQRGDTERTLSAINAIPANEHSLEAPLDVELQYLNASALLQAGDSESAISLVKQMPEHSKWRFYIDYNLAALKAKEGDFQTAQAHYATFDTLPLRDAEHLALFERAQTASGYALLAADRPHQARAAFERVSLSGPAADKAMLGFGWAALRAGDYLDALRAWQPLTERSMLYAPARESLLAVPYAYEQLGRPELALTRYREATEVYTRQLTGLSRVIESFSEGELHSLLGLTQEASGEEAVMGWLDSTSIFPPPEQAQYMQFLISRHSFQVALRELRDLYDMAARLRDARSRLAVLRQVDRHQQAIWAEVNSQDRQRQHRETLAHLRHRFASLEARVSSAVREGDSRALADQPTRARWARLERALDSARDLGRAEDVSRAERLRGLQIWEDAEDFASRSYKARQSVAALARELDAATPALARVDEALGQRSQHGAASRITELESVVAVQLTVVEQVTAQAEAQARATAIAALEAQADQLERARSQSALAIARLHDAHHNQQRWITDAGAAQ